MLEKRFGILGVYPVEEFPYVIINDDYFEKRSDPIRDAMGSESRAIANMIWNYRQIYTTPPPESAFALLSEEYYEDSDIGIPPLEDISVPWNFSESQ